MKKTRIFISAAVAVSLSQLAFAVPAKPGYVLMDTPDGELKVRIAGDEFFHQYFSEEGYPISERGGRFFYCDIAEDGALIETSIPATSLGQDAKEYKRKLSLSGLESRLERRAKMARESKSLNAATFEGSKRSRRAESGEIAGPPYEPGYGLFPLSKGSRFPSYGKQKGLVILVAYNDVDFTIEEPYDYFNRMLNEEGFTDYGATGSAADYFKYNSMNAFEPEFDVYGPVKLSKNRTYYGANDPWGNDMRPHQMVIEALDALDSEVDFSQYDCDGDGYIDNVFIFYAGRGEASGGGPATVWPHANTLTALKEPDHVYDGVTADRYACTNEWTGSRPDGVGTFIHEFSHVMGLPDLYPTSYASSFTPDSWSAMDHGSYNNEGMTPPLYSAFERYALGWMRPNEIDRPVTASLQPIGNNMGGILRTDRDTEYFLFENRQHTGWDAYLPGHGMLIWHIDYNEAIWTNNTVNNTPSHQYVDLMEADNIRTEDTRSGDCFPGTANVTSFTAATSPGMTTWGGVDLEYPITGIKESAEGIISFNVLGGASNEMPRIESKDATDVTATDFMAHWNAREGFDHLVSVYTKNAASPEAVEFVGKYRYYNAGGAAELKVTGLAPSETYYYTVIATNGWEMGEPSEEKTVKTDRMNLSYYTVETDDPTDITSDGFTAKWFALDGAEGYEVSLFKQEETEPNVAVCDFSDGVANLPEGWSSTSSASYGMASYCGEAAPSLRLGKDGEMLETPLFGDEIASVKFWHRGNGVKGGAKLSVEAKVKDEYAEVESVAVKNEAGGEISEITLPEGTYQLRIKLINLEGSGSVALDDVAVTYGMNYDYIPYAGFEKTDAKNSCEYSFTGLPSETVFGYMVTAYDSSYRSIPSEMKLVKTGRVSGVTETGETAPFIRIAGNKIMLAGRERGYLYDITGALLAEGAKSLAVPCPGVYVVRFPKSGRSVKIYVK